MNPKTICFFALIALTCADVKVPVPERYPPGVDPSICPGYPVCDNALLHGTERIAALPTYYKTVVPTYRYTYVHDNFPVNFGRTVFVPSTRTFGPVLRSIVSPVVSVAAQPAPIQTIAPLSKDTPLDPNKPIIPFASSPAASSVVLNAF